MGPFQTVQCQKANILKLKGSPAVQVLFNSQKLEKQEWGSQINFLGHESQVVMQIQDSF